MQQPTSTKAKKPYKSPALEKMPPKEAQTRLLDHARKGNQGADDILELVLSTLKDSSN